MSGGAGGGDVGEAEEVERPRVKQRRHQAPRRDNRVNLRVDDAELEVIRRGAARAGMTPAGFATEAALEAARAGAAPGPGAVRQVLEQLMLARVAVRRYATNVNQAAKVLNAGGEAPVWLADAVAGSDRAVVRVDQAAEAAVAALRRAR